jgi:hypothetical protein
MTFLAPLWLIALLPWGGVLIWMLMGRRPQARVPFVALWPNQTPTTRPSARLHRPPALVVLLLLAMLLGILGAASPVLRGMPSPDAHPITIILDRGFTMSAAGRWQKLLPALSDALQARFGDGPVRLIPLPDGKPLDSDRRTWRTLALALDPSPADTRPALQEALASALRGDRPIFVITDQPLERRDERLVQIAPADPVSNVGIITASASRTPGPQVMVRLRNDSPQRQAELRVGSMVKRIDLPPTGAEGNLFIDIASIGDSLPIALDAADDQPADNHGTLQLRHARPRLEPAGALPADVQRIIASYSKVRPAGAGALPLRISPDPPAGDSPAVQLAPATQPMPPGQLLLSDHPINDHVDWSQIDLSGARVATAPPGDGWTPIVRIDQRPLVAVRENPQRHVWIGFASEPFGRSAAFVVFWTNLLDWAGQGAEVFAYEGAPAVPLPPAVDVDWRTRLAALPAPLAGGRPVGHWLIFAAELLAFLGVLRWGHLQ